MKILENTEDYITGLLYAKLSPGIVYHDITHTRYVVAAAEDLASVAMINERDRCALLLSAWFHDAGYCFSFEGHEAISMTLATDFLRAENCKDHMIRLVVECIRATRMPQRPESKLQALMCDADMAHLADDDFTEHTDHLRQEWSQCLQKSYTDEEWDQQNLMFMQEHRFFTTQANQLWESKKSKNIEMLRMKILNKLL